MMTRQGQSLQWRLWLGLAAAIVVTGLVAGTLSFLWAMRDANEILDSGLQQTASLVRSGQITLPSLSAQLPGTEPENDMLVVRLGISTPRAPLPATALPESLPDGLQTLAWNGSEWRVLAVTMPGGERFALAQQTDVRDEIARHSALRTVLPLLTLLPLLVLVVREVVRRTLSPVLRLARHVDSNPTSLAAHLPDVDVPREVQPFVRSIQRLLDDLTHALAQQQRFVANAAHELRSPVAALQLQAANVEHVVREPMARERLADLQLGIQRVQRLLEQLLSMARSQAVPVEGYAPVDLSQTAREVLAELLPAAEQQGIDLGADRCDPGVCVRATALDMATLLRNVLGNAIKYSGPGAVVTLSVLQEGGDAVVVVEDDGPGIAPGDLEHVFEPFYRAPGTGQPGSGLGLAIVAAIGQRLGARVALGPRAAGHGLRFEYRQPHCACART
jgi:two-component system OmpR family sensor kinase